MLHTKKEGKEHRGWRNQIRKAFEIRGENWGEIEDNRKWEK